MFMKTRETVFVKLTILGSVLVTGGINKYESSAETLHPPALVYSCTSPRFYLLKGSDHVVSTYYSVNFLLT